MKSQIDEYFARVLPAWVDFARVHGQAVIWTCLLITLLAGALTYTRLGVNSDNLLLISKDVPSRQNMDAFAELFPDLENALLVVIDAKTPELARQAENRLIERLRAESEEFETAYPAAGGEFFETHGLLYRDLEDLDLFAEQMARLQPIITALDQNPNLSNLAELVAEGLEQSATGQGQGIGPEDWAVILDSVGQATVEVYAEFPLALSWEELLLRGSALDVSNRRVVVVRPRAAEDVDLRSDDGGAVALAVARDRGPPVRARLDVGVREGHGLDIEHLQRRADHVAAVVLVLPEQDEQAGVHHRDRVALAGFARAAMRLRLLPPHGCGARTSGAASLSHSAPWGRNAADTTISW